MTTSIKSIPLLKGKEARLFDAQATANTFKKASIKFSKETAIALKIWAKAKISL